MSDRNVSCECSVDYEAVVRLEDPSEYKPGGYYPLEIGGKVHNGRYRILHRLGHGAHSTTWLALDQSYDSSAPPDPPRPRYVSLKIGTASRSQQEASYSKRCTSLAIKMNPGVLLNYWITSRSAGQMAHTAVWSPSFLVQVSPMSIVARAEHPPDRPF